MDLQPEIRIFRNAFEVSKISQLNTNGCVTHMGRTKCRSEVYSFNGTPTNSKLVLRNFLLESLAGPDKVPKLILSSKVSNPSSKRPYITAAW